MIEELRGMEYEERLRQTRLVTLEARRTRADLIVVQRHSNKYETNCSNCSKSTKIGTHVD